MGVWFEAGLENYVGGVGKVEVRVQVGGNAVGRVE